LAHEDKTFISLIRPAQKFAGLLYSYFLPEQLDGVLPNKCIAISADFTGLGQFSHYG
jgi:hypothetical protein